MTDADLLSLALTQIIGKRLIYAELTGKTVEAPSDRYLSSVRETAPFRININHWQQLAEALASALERDEPGPLR
jgi:hypothetical protein